jgi:hypothetical protein
MKKLLHYPTWVLFLTLFSCSYIEYKTTPSRKYSDVEVSRMAPKHIGKESKGRLAFHFFTAYYTYSSHFKTNRLRSIYLKADPRFGFGPTEIHGYDQNQDGHLEVMWVREFPRDRWSVMFYVRDSGVKQTRGNSLDPVRANEYYELLRTAIDSLHPQKGRKK